MRHLTELAACAVIVMALVLIAMRRHGNQPPPALHPEDTQVVIQKAIKNLQDIANNPRTAQQATTTEAR